VTVGTLGQNMKPCFQNLDIECWEHSGRLGLLEPSLCLFQANVNECEPLLLAIDELCSTEPPAKRTLTFKPCQRPRACTTGRLILLAESDELRQMHISREGATVTIELTPAGLRAIREAVERWHEGNDDFGVAPRWKRNKRRELGSKDLASGELWFWGPYYAGP
jgi:hypothetical protein